MAGVDLRTLAQLFGHKTLQMVMQYSHLSQSHELAAVEGLCDTGISAAETNDTISDTSIEEVVGLFSRYDDNLNNSIYLTLRGACSSMVRAGDS
jgi:hypothetical protein